jgi:5'-3' exonuclease
MSLLLLDSASLWYRAYFGMPDTLVSPKGDPINAIRGFLDMSAKLIGIYKPNRLVACLEGDWRPSWRVDLFPGYKANRLDEDGEEEEPDTLSPQIPILLDVLDAFGIESFGVDDYEADDVIATLSKTEKGPIRIVTGDRDLFQLVDDKKDVKIVYLAKGLTNHDLVDSKWVSDRYEIPGDRYALFASIRGDASDGLPGLKGIGEKGAALLANTFSDLNSIVKAAKNGDDRIKASLAKKIIESEDYAKVAPTLVNCATNVPIPDINEDLNSQKMNIELIRDLQKEHGLGASIDRLISAIESL